ncbi:hypothetical protein HY546_03740, partial [archaeon]|nr:hypothetical protein [archaeon]
MEPDKVKKAVDAIRGMNASGMTLVEIRSSLKSMNIKDSVIDELLAKARTGPTPKEIHEAVASLHEKLESGEHLKPISEALHRHAASSEEVHAKISDIHAAAEEHSQRLSEVHGKLSEHAESIRELHEPVRKLLQRNEELKKSVGGIQDVAEELGRVKSLLMEMRPTLNALRDLNAK